MTTQEPHQILSTLSSLSSLLAEADAILAALNAPTTPTNKAETHQTLAQHQTQFKQDCEKASQDIAQLEGWQETLSALPSLDDLKQQRDNLKTQTKTHRAILETHLDKCYSLQDTLYELTGGVSLTDGTGGGAGGLLELLKGVDGSNAVEGSQNGNGDDEDEDEEAEEDLMKE